MNPNRREEAFPIRLLFETKAPEGIPASCSDHPRYRIVSAHIYRQRSLDLESVRRGCVDDDVRVSSVVTVLQLQQSWFHNLAQERENLHLGPNAPEMSTPRV